MNCQMTRIAIPAKTKKAITNDLTHILSSMESVTIKDPSTIRQFSSDISKAAILLNTVAESLNRLTTQDTLAVAPTQSQNQPVNETPVNTPSVTPRGRKRGCASATSTPIELPPTNKDTPSHDVSHDAQHKKIKVKKPKKE